MVYFPGIEAYEAKVFTRMDLVQCRVWAEDQGSNRIAGDDGYHDCSGSDSDMIIGTGSDGPNDRYWIIVKVLAGTDDYYHEAFTNHTCVCVMGNFKHIKIRAHIIDDISNCDDDIACFS
ncbi:7520_t:CDS:2 [Gigaspora rosea]|nr:7520_t:CDS:2 [Gigaspora rosea]